MYPYQPQMTPFFPGLQQPQAPAANVLPQQQVLQANGKASIDALRMAPNSSVLIMDTTAPLVWLCTSDSLGNVTPSPYDITPHKDAPEPDSIEARLTAVEANVSQMMEVLKNEKPDARPVKSKPSGKSDSAD